MAENCSWGRSGSAGYSGTGDSFQVSSNDGWTENYGESESSTRGAAIDETMDFVLEASDFTALATATDNVGGHHRQLKGIAQAYVFRLGRVWSTGTTHLLSQFDRNIK